MFNKLMCSLITPFSIDNKIDYPALKKIINYVYDTGSDTIVVASEVGEGSSLNIVEKIYLLQSAILFKPSNMKIIASINQMNIEVAKEIVTMYNELELDGLLISAPHFILTNQEGIYEYITTLAKISKHPILLNNIPKRVGVEIDYKTILAIKEESNNVIGFIDNSKNTLLIKKIKDNLPEFLTYTSNDGFLLPTLQAGGDGILSVGSNAFGVDFKEAIENYYLNINDEPLNNYLEIICNLLEYEIEPIVIKYIMSKKGFCYNVLRSPLLVLNEKYQENVNDLLGY